MADFETSYTKTLTAEGGYANVPGDRGGETYRGIARRMHPGWGGWKIIDGHKGEPDFPRCLDRDELLQAQVREFYLQEFWNPLRLAPIPSQAVADEMFDTGVNMGQGVAVKCLQQALNLMNGNGKYWPELAVDGRIGPGTLGVLEKCCKRGWDCELVTWMNVLQGARFVEIMRQDPTQEDFARGWSRRIEFKKSVA